MINVIWGTTKKPFSSRQLATFFQSNNDEYTGELYIGYPIIAAPEGAFPIDALWVSRNRGLVIFSLIEGTDLKGYPDAQDESANRLARIIHEGRR